LHAVYVGSDRQIAITRLSLPTATDVLSLVKMSGEGPLESDHLRLPAVPRLSDGLVVLEPQLPETARAFLNGDLSNLLVGEGWPHADTLDAMRMSVLSGAASRGWFVEVDGRVIGDCGVLGGIDAAGDVEIGYGLAAPSRGRGYGLALVKLISRWLLAQPGVKRVVAREVLADNVASRRTLERAGFVLERATDDLVWYATTAVT
jgi:RimJ/RimL family protein N-acetyltransferase